MKKIVVLIMVTVMALLAAVPVFGGIFDSGTTTVTVTKSVYESELITAKTMPQTVCFTDDESGITICNHPNPAPRPTPIPTVRSFTNHYKAGNIILLPVGTAIYKTKTTNSKVVGLVVGSSWMVKVTKTSNTWCGVETIGGNNVINGYVKINFPPNLLIFYPEE